MTGLIADFHFIRPVWLLLLPVAAVLWWRWQISSDPLSGWREQVASELLDYLVVDQGPGYRRAAGWLLIAWLTGIVALAGPTWKLEPSPFAEDAPPLLVLLKAESSMEQQDLEPSRIEYARLKIADLAEVRKGQPLGLIAYAGSAHLVLPPTRDTAVVSEMAKEISPTIMPVPGDRLDLAIGRAADILAGGGKGGSLVVLADSVGATEAQLKQVQAKSGVPVQFLSINGFGSPADPSLAAAARALNAGVESLTVDSSDILAVVRRAAGRTLPAKDGLSNRWQEAGYWLVVPLCMILLVSFRREARVGVT